jgi:CBS domain containing-hemolysin-like protein
MDIHSFFDTETLIWLGIIFCISQSAMFSGLNLAFFSMSMLFLEVESSHGNKQAEKILTLRKDSNFLLTTILWGNVGINVLLTLLSDSVLAGVSAFAFSTIFITLFGEILPQAYFSRNALKMASRLYPILRFYQYLLFLVAKPSALFLDAWLGREGIDYLREQELKNVITKHVEADEAEVDHVEGIGALNFLAIDDIKVAHEGELITPESIICLPSTLDLPTIPEIDRSPDDPFLQQLHQSGHNWVVLCDEAGEPHLIMDADGALRTAIFDRDIDFEPYRFCHRPMIIKDEEMTLDEVILHFKSDVYTDKHDDSAIEFDVVLVWGKEPRIITGADLLGRLLKGIVSR